MKLINAVQIVFVQLKFFALVVSVSTCGGGIEKQHEGGKEKQQDCPGNTPFIPHRGACPTTLPCIIHGDCPKNLPCYLPGEEKSPSDYVWIPLWILIAAVSMVFLPWFLWRIIPSWGRWKIHTRSPRPHYIKTPFGWVDRETWELRKERRAKRKETHRDQHKFYRTTKANYKWMFHDPTGELQQRFDDQKKRSYLRLLPSWMRSYPHGTLQSGTLAQQREVPKGIYPLSGLQLEDNSRLSLPELLEHAQIDGYVMSGALPNEYPSAIIPRISGKPGLLPKLPIMGGSDVIQVWHIRDTPLPEFETEHIIEVEGSQETTNEIDQPPRVEERSFHYLRFTIPLPPFPPVTISQASQVAPGAEHVAPAVRQEVFIDRLAKRIKRVPIEGVRANRPMDDTGRRLVPMAVPGHVREAIALHDDIEELESRMQDLLNESSESSVRGTLDDLRSELRTKRIELGRLNPVARLRPAVLTSRGQLQNNQSHQLSTPNQSTAVAVDSRPRMLPLAWVFEVRVEIPHSRDAMGSDDDIRNLANHNFQVTLQDAWFSWEFPDVQVSAANMEALNSIFETLTALNVNATNPIVLSPFTRGEGSSTGIDGSARGDEIMSSSMSEEGTLRLEDCPSLVEDSPPPDTHTPRDPSIMCSMQFDVNVDPFAHAYATIRRDVLRHMAAFLTATDVTDCAFEVLSNSVPGIENDILNTAPNVPDQGTQAGIFYSASDFRVQDVRMDEGDIEMDTIEGSSSPHASVPGSPATGAQNAMATVQDVQTDNGDIPMDTIEIPSSPHASVPGSPATGAQHAMARLGLSGDLGADAEDLYTDAY